jgi:hypothetical protein
MTLASSGDINLAGASSSPQRSILAELGATAPISLISTSTRSLTGISSGPITMPTDFYGKSLLSYSLYLPYTAVTEGSSVPVVALTNGVSNGTVLYWTIVNGSTTNADFTIPFGSVTINSGSGQIDITPVSDGLTDGGETFTVQLRTGSTSGSVVATSGAITINDPSSGSYLYYFAYPQMPTGANYFTVLPGMTSIDLVAVGGGGGGGSITAAFGTSLVPGAGGGAGGQVRTQTGYTVTPGEILTVTVGSGGGIASGGGTTSIQGNAGATLIQAEGGGPGGSITSGGAGTVGGTGGQSKTNGGSIVYANATSLKPGGGGSSTIGPGAPGGEDIATAGGAGADGATYTLGGFSWNLSGGGGGGSYTSNPGGPGGFGGGGTGSSVTTIESNAVGGVMFTGGGGGGARGYVGPRPEDYAGGAPGGRGALYFISSVQPTAKLPAPITLESDYNNAAGLDAQAFTELVFTDDGRITTTEGNNSYVAYPNNINGSWLTSSPAATSTSTAGLYDIELTPSNSTLVIDGVQTTIDFDGSERTSWSTGTDWNTRLQLGNSSGIGYGRYLLCEVLYQGTGGTAFKNATINYTATIYLHATNTVVTSTQVTQYCQASAGIPL